MYLHCRWTVALFTPHTLNNPTVRTALMNSWMFKIDRIYTVHTLNNSTFRTALLPINHKYWLCDPLFIPLLLDFREGEATPFGGESTDKSGRDYTKMEDSSDKGRDWFSFQGPCKAWRGEIHSKIDKIRSLL